jgi:poly-beta-1,6-N-acetyl-D-glucosamine synthase
MYQFIIYSSFSLIIYSYLVYPALLFLHTRFVRPRRPAEPEGVPASYPFVSVIIAAYNEEAVIEEKIRNTLALDYPRDRIEILIGSDGSDDQTDAICERYREAITFVRIEPRSGKANVLNTLIPRAHGEMILFSDANTHIVPHALRKIVANLDDPTVGGVCGRLVLKSLAGQLVTYEGIYWSYESYLKLLESEAYSTIGANGGIYAIRKALYLPIPEDTIIDDFLISMNILEQGKRIVYEAKAVAYEDVSHRFLDEFLRKVRIGAGNLQILLRKPWLTNYPSLFIRWAFVSHKVIRWVIPFLLILIYGASFMLYGQGWFTYLFLFYTIGLGVGVVGLVSRANNRLVHPISYLFSSNFALLLGYARYVLGLQKVTWRRAVR